MELFALLAIIFSWQLCRGSVILRDNGYEGVVVSIADDIGAHECQHVIESLESLLHQSSKVLFQVTRKRAYFKDIKVMVPNSWSPTTCPSLQGRLATASVEGSSDADLRVTKARHPVYGSKPWTSQSEGCAQKGDYVSLGSDLLLKNSTNLSARLLAHAWIKYQYGVFDELNIGDDNIHSPNYRGQHGNWVPSACSNVPLQAGSICNRQNSSCTHNLWPVANVPALTSSFMAFPQIESVNELCDEGTHNSAAPTEQNLVCDSKSVWEVLRASADFQKNRNVEGRSHHGHISFTYLQVKPPRIVVLIEDTDEMNMQKRWDFMRKAIRKLVIYDVPGGLEVGLVVFDSIATTKYPIKPLNDIGTRYNLGSSLPRNPSRVEKHHRCISCGLEESVKLLQQSGGTSGGHIVLVVAGSSRTSPQQVERVRSLLAGTNTVLHVIVYPLTEKFPKPGEGIESFATKTGGLSFTIQDEGIGADSKISMYYNLLDALYNTLSSAARTMHLPVKIHSEEHEGGLAQNSEGSFWLDPALGADTVFAVFYYDLAHVGDTIHLTSPQGQVIDTDNMQREDDNMNMITIRLRKNQEIHGRWHYRLENRANSHQSLFVQVTSRRHSRQKSADLVARTWTNHKEINVTELQHPLKIFAEVRADLAPISDAKVIATFRRLGSLINGTQHQPITVRLLDNGLLSPDTKKADGIYSRYVQGLTSGKYTADVQIEGQMAKFKFMRQLQLGIINVVGVKRHEDLLAPSRITDFRAALLPHTNGQISFTWTAPGDNFDYGQAKSYEIFVSESIAELKEGLGVTLEGWPSPLIGLSIQQHTITWEKFDQLYLVAIQASDDNGNTAPLSNIVEIYVPRPQPPKPSTVINSPKLADSTSNVIDAAGTSFSSVAINYLPIILTCVGVVLAASVGLIVYLVNCKGNHKKRSPKKDNRKDNISVTISVNGKNFTDNPLVPNSLKKSAPMNTWSPTDLLGGHAKRTSISGSDHSEQSSSKKSFDQSSEPPQYTYNSLSYQYDVNGCNESYDVQNNAYSSANPTLTTYADSYAPHHQATGYISPHHDSHLSQSCDTIPGSQGPPGYSPYPVYDGSLRALKIPPPIPPKPKVGNIAEAYMYDNHEFTGNSSSNASVTSCEKRVRNVTMV